MIGIKQNYSLTPLWGIYLTIDKNELKLYDIAIKDYAEDASNYYGNNKKKSIIYIRTMMKPAPIADRIPYIVEIKNKKISDEYFWLRDNDWPKVKNKKILSYLEEENKYFEEFFLPLEKDKSKIFEELKSRITQNDQSPYIKKDDYYYYTKYEDNKEYKIYCRKCGNIDAQEEILLDVNYLAQNKKFIKLNSFSVSPNHKLIAYSVDFIGDEKYAIKIYNIETKEYLIDEIPETIGNIVWHEELEGFFYTPTNNNWRYDSVKFHFLETELSSDKLVFHEPDELYQVTIKKSASCSYLYINVKGYNNNENYYISMSNHNFTPQLVIPKQEGIFYNIEHNNDYFYIKTNYKANNFHIIRLSLDELQKNCLATDYINEEDGKYLSSFVITKNYLILNYLIKGIPHIKIKKISNGEERVINLPDQVFTAAAESTNFYEDDIRINYSSLVRPNICYSYDFDTDCLSILKAQEIPLGYNSDEYVVERIFAVNKEVEVPITLLYKKSLFKKDGSNPLYLYGYGSYGVSIALEFQSSLISLVNAGFIYGISHIRGGSDLGHEWYKSAKLLNKKRSFEDFILSIEQLIKEKYTRKRNIVICGKSAGGMLIGNVINERADLLKAAITYVPFVDVLNTMLDETLPLTPGEFNEWGNPKNQMYFDYIKSYSPYDNVKIQNYPNLLITSGLSDPRVGYWEAAKWAAKIRSLKTDNNILLLKTNMGTGHFGVGGRFGYLKEQTEELVFLFKIFSINYKI